MQHLDSNHPLHYAKIGIFYALLNSLFDSIKQNMCFTSKKGKKENREEEIIRKKEKNV